MDTESMLPWSKAEVRTRSGFTEAYECMMAGSHPDGTRPEHWRVSAVVEGAGPDQPGC